jgi:hypothetical protein
MHPKTALYFLFISLFGISCSLNHQTHSESQVTKLTPAQEALSLFKKADINTPKLRRVTLELAQNPEGVHRLFQVFRRMNPYLRKLKDATPASETKGMLWELTHIVNRSNNLNIPTELSSAEIAQTVHWLDSLNPLETLKAAHSIVIRTVDKTLHNELLIHIVTLFIDMKFAPAGFKSIYLTTAGMEALITLAQHDLNQFLRLMSQPMDKVLEALKVIQK